MKIPVYFEIRRLYILWFICRYTCNKFTYDVSGKVSLDWLVRSQVVPDDYVRKRIGFAVVRLGPNQIRRLVFFKPIPIGQAECLALQVPIYFGDYISIHETIYIHNPIAENTMLHHNLICRWPV